MQSATSALTPSTTPTPTPTTLTPAPIPTPTNTATPTPPATPTPSPTTVPPNCRIKGNISNGDRVYHTPDSPYYARTHIDPAHGERWFCTEREAQAAGWRPPGSNNRATPSATCANPININAADAPALETLPGIGETLAQRILDHRATIAAFTAIDQLTDIKGIGPKTLAKIRPCISLD